MKVGLSGWLLSLLAMASMTVDHIGAILFPEDLAFRMVGRLAFPTFAFLLAEGARHSHSRLRYGLRLLGLAVLSELPFDYAFFGGWNMGHQNIFFTLCLGLAAIELSDRLTAPAPRVAGLLAVIMLAEFLHTDYGSLGVLLVFVFYLWGTAPRPVACACLIFAGLLYMDLSLLLGTVAAALPLSLYDHRRGGGKIPEPIRKFFCYGYYPLHLIVVKILSTL